MKPKYRFLTKDEFNKPCHRHQILVKDKWIDATGGSTVVDVLGKVLTYWAAELAAVECLESGSQIVTIRQEYLEAVKSDNKKKAIDALQVKYPIFKTARFAHTVRLASSAEEGTDMHAKLEEYVKECMKRGGEPEQYEGEDKRVKEFSIWACKDIKRFIWSEAHCYHEDLFLGGITDVGAEMMDGSYAIIDFKSAKEAYFNHFIQVAVYNLLIEKNGLVDGDGNPYDADILFPKITKYFIIPFGAKEFTVHENANVDELKKAALACIQLNRAKAQFEGK